MRDADLEALNVYEEAGGEPDEGKAAVARVVRNRMKARFMSDGTVAGTVLARDQFSWAWFGFVTKMSGHANPNKHLQEYVRLCRTREEAEARADQLYSDAVPRYLANCFWIASQVAANTYHGPLYDRLGDAAISYLNPRILTRLPKWATADKLIVSIGHHDFYRSELPLVS
jgi:hypothetical protein